MAAYTDDSGQEYVIIISTHNVAELYACLQFSPTRVLTIATQHFKAAEERFHRVLRRLKPKIERMKVMTEGLHGDQFHQGYYWAKLHLHSYLRPKHKKVLNATGGTKALILALEQAIDWDQIHYKGINSSSIEVIPMENHRFREEERREASCQIDPLIYQQVAVDDICHLYLENMLPDKTSVYPKPNGSIDLATKIWSIIEQPHHPHWHLAKYLNNAWRDKKSLSISQMDFEGDEEWMAFKIWSQYISESLPNLLKVGKDGIEILLDYTHCKQTLFNRKWLEGGWLEELVYQWIYDSGIASQHIHVSMNVQANNNKNDAQGSEREIDLCILNNEKLTIIEVKAGVPNRSMLTQAERQLSSVGSFFPASNKVLFLGPWAQDKLPTNQLKREFQSQCRAAGVYVVMDQASLLALFR